MIELESLHNLVGGYINEDFVIDHGGFENAVDNFARDEPEYAPALRSDIRTALCEFEDDQQLRAKLQEMGLGYSAVDAGWPSYRAWLLAVADRVDAVLEAQLNRRRPA